MVNCGADIVAITAWMTTEMGKLRSLIAETPVAHVSGAKTNGVQSSEKAPGVEVDDITITKLGIYGA